MFEATYTFFQHFCEFVVWLEKPKSGEISDVLVLKVDDRDATAVCMTPYFHGSIPHGNYTNSSDFPHGLSHGKYCLLRVSRFAAPSY